MRKWEPHGGSTHPLEAPTVIGKRYRVLSSLGRGTFGEVFLAEDLLEPGRKVALKTKRLDPFSSANHPANLAQEFRVLTRLRHPHLARVFDLGFTRDHVTRAPQVYFTREYVDGLEMVRALKDASGDIIARGAALLCHALAAIHDHGIVHGDLSPTNVLGPPGKPEGLKIIDFGLAEIMGQGEGSQVSGLRGSLHYIAPEMLRGAPVSARTDLYALGALLYHVSAGHPPFKGTPAAVIQQHLDSAPPPLEDVRQDLPEELTAVIRRLLAKDPNHRYASAWNALNDLEGTSSSSRRPVVEAPLLGRDAELAQLARLVRPESEARLVVIVGDDGAGRSRLLEALRWQLELDGRAEVLDLSMTGAGTDPLASVRELLAKLTLVGDHEPSHQLLIDLRAERKLPPESALTLWHALSSFAVEALQPSSAVVLLDDLHLASDPCLEAFKSLARAIDETRALPPLVVAARPGPQIDQIVAEVEHAERVELDELGVGDVERLVAALAGRPLPDLAQRIRSHAGGLPGYVEEVTRTILERGTEATDGALPLPTGLESAVVERVGRLARDERQVLEVLAVMGRVGSWEQVSTALNDLDRETFLRSARRLCSAGYLVEGEGLAFSFHSNAVCKAVEASCSTRRRRSLHALFSELFAPAGELLPRGEPLVTAARHALGAHSRGAAAARAVELVLAAATQLKGDGAATAATELLEPALALAEGAPLRRLRLSLAEARATVGEYDEAVSLLESAAAAEEGAAKGAVLVKAGGVLERQGAYDRAARCLAQALELDLSNQASAEGLEVLARVHLARGAFAEAILATERARERELDEGLAARVMAIGGIAATYQGHHRQALELLRAAKVRASASGETSTQALVAGHLAIAFGRSGEKRKSLEAYRDAARLAEEGGDIGRLPAHLMNLGVAHHALGEYGKALLLYRRAARLARRMGKRSVVVAALVNLADVFAFLGAAEEGRKIALRALVLAQQRGMTAFAARARQALAECAACQSPAAGVEDARGAAALFREIGMASNALEADLVAAELMLWAGEPFRAEQAATRAEERAGELEERELAARAALVGEECRIARNEEPRRAGVLEELNSDDSDLAEELRWRALAALGERARRRGEIAGATRFTKDALDELQRSASKVPPEHRESMDRHPARRALLRLGEPEARSSVAEARVFRLMEVNRAVLSEHDPRKLLALALDTAIELCGAERGFLITVGPRGAVHVEVARNLDREAVRSARLKVSRSIAEEVARTGKPMLTVDAREDERFSHFASVQDLRLRSVMCVPIRGREEMLGTLYLDNRFESARFDESDLRLLLAFADVVAVSLDNARLIEENTHKAAELEDAKGKLEATSHHQARQLESALRELEATREALGLKYDYSQIIGQSQKMLRVFKVLDRVIDTHVPVLIHGESGTGKELIARAIHFNGPRKQAPFVSVNCGAIPESLLESELFGHVRGAFTGATTDREGLFPSADGGTLFLDEIGDMSLAMQTKLLRALQEGEVRPVGAVETRRVNVRVVSASHRDLALEVGEGRFREDLFYRINVVQLELPPLRERRDDIPALAEHILERCIGELGGVPKRMTAAAVERLLEHDWPGNVRELENLLKNAAVLSSGPTIDGEDVLLPQHGTRQMDLGGSLKLVDVERQTIERALESAGGNKKKAAELLGIARLTLYRKLKSDGK